VRDEDSRNHGTISFKEYLFESEREKHNSILKVLRSRSHINIKTASGAKMSPTKAMPDE
jgi:hypothetical protein